MGYHQELRKLSRTQRIISMLPEKLKFRIAKKLYDYESSAINGIDLVAPLQNDGAVCFINTKDLIGWKIFFFGEYETGTNEAMARYIKPDDIVIEAGANLGSETILIARQLKGGHLYSFEPNPYTFDRLKVNVNINGLKNVDVYDDALGEKDGTIHFHIYPKNFCNPGMSSKYMATKETRKIDVNQLTLDTFVKTHHVPRVNFIKMDIQGAEMDLILGAHDTISKYKPTIFAEAFDLFNDTQQLYGKLKEYGYNVYFIDDHSIQLMATPAEIKEGNWLARYEA